MSEKVKPQVGNDDVQLSAFMKKIVVGPKAVAAANPATPNPGTGSAESTRLVADTPALADGGNGNNGGNAQNNGGSSGGEWFGKFFEGLTFEKAVPLLATLCLAYGSVYWATHDTPPNKAAENLAAANSLSAMANTFNGGGSSAANAQAKVTMDPLKHFTCRTEDEVMNGFLHASVDYINTSKQSLRIPTGCVLVRFTGDITRISGNYMVFVPNKDEATSEFKWRFCGNGSPAPNYNHPSSECVNLVNENKSEDIRIVSYTRTLIE